MGPQAPGSGDSAARPTQPNFDALDQMMDLFKSDSSLYAGAQSDEDLLLRAGDCLGKLIHRPQPAELVLGRTLTASGALTLLHIRDDYIPTKVMRDAKFYELEFLQALAHFHGPDDLIVDVGANIGNHTVYFAQVLGAKVAAFEPEPHNVLCLELNVLLNGVRDSVTVHRLALGETPGMVSLTMSIDSNYGSFSAAPAVNPNGRPGAASTTCASPVSTLDQVLDARHANQPVSLMKIDVEGMEMAVLRGASGTVQAWRPLVACECLNDSTFEGVEALLAGWGYSVVGIFNSTPTFLFCDLKQITHVTRLSDYLRSRVVSNAYGRKGFVRS